MVAQRIVPSIVHTAVVYTNVSTTFSARVSSTFTDAPKQANFGLSRSLGPTTTVVTTDTPTGVRGRHVRRAINGHNVVLIPLYDTLPPEWRNPQFWHDIDLQKITATHREFILAFVSDFLRFFRYDTTRPYDWRQAQEDAKTHFRMESILGWDHAPQTLRLRLETGTGVQEMIYVSDLRYYGGTKGNGEHALRYRWSYIPVEATFKVGRTALRTALEGAWRIDYYGNTMGVGLMFTHSGFGKARFLLSSQEAASGKALLARNEQGITLRVAVAHEAESLREHLEGTPGMPWPAHDEDYHLAKEVRPGSPEELVGMRDIADGIDADYEEGEDEDDGETDEDVAFSSVLVDANAPEQENEEELRQHWTQLRAVHENLANVVEVDPSRLRAIGQGDQYTLVRVSLDISKIQAIPRHHESLLLAHLGDGEMAGVARGMSTESNRIWIEVISGLLQQVMALIPWWEMKPVPNGIQNYLRMVAVAAQMDDVSLDQLATEPTVWTTLLHRALLAGNTSQSSRPFPVVLRRGKAEKKGGVGTNVPWLTMGMFGKQTHQAFVDIFLPRLLVLALHMGLAGRVKQEGRDISVVVGQHMVPCRAYPAPEVTQEEFENIKSSEGRLSAGRIMAVCMPPGDAAMRAKDDGFNHSNKAGSLKHMNLLVTVNGLTPPTVMGQLLNFTPPLLNKGMKEAQATQLLLHNQTVELVPLMLHPSPIANTDLEAGIKEMAPLTTDQTLLEFLDSQQSIVSNLIAQKRTALEVVDMAHPVENATEVGRLGNVENCPPHSQAAWFVLQTAKGTNNGPAPKRARRGERSEASGKGKKPGVKGKTRGRSSQAGPGSSSGKGKGEGAGSWWQPVQRTTPQERLD